MERGTGSITDEIVQEYLEHHRVDRMEMRISFRSSFNEL